MSAAPSAALTRRRFLQGALAAGGGLVLAYYVRSSGRAQVAHAASLEDTFAPNDFIRVAPDGTVTIYSARPEVGQGIKTSLPMVVAEEMDADWHHVRVESVPLADIYGPQFAGGSMSTPMDYTRMRQLGAAARTMLIEAAAKTWGVPVSECYAENGYVRHRDTGRTLGFGALAAAAATLPPPALDQVVLKDPSQFRLLGSRQGGVDNPAIVTGRPLFGIDQKQPGMLYAVYQKCPVWAGRPVSANLDEIKALPGIRDAFIQPRTFPEGELTGLLPGVAIVGDSTWAVFSARQRLRVQWDEGPYAASSWTDFAQQAQAAARRGSGRMVRQTGDVDGALAAGAKVVEAAYTYPFISHTNLEPQNCTASVKAGKVRVWAPTQNPGLARQRITEMLGIRDDDVDFQLTRIGGGFGRRLDPDPVLEAVAIAQRTGTPVMLVWDRTDDLQHDHYRPGGFHYLRGAVDPAGRVSAWRMHHVNFGSGLGPDDFPAPFIPNFQLLDTRLDNGIPMGPWRAPGANAYAFVIGSFLDELAHAAGQDPLAFNLALLGDRKLIPATTPKGQPYNAERMRGAIRVAAEKSGWGQPLPRGRGRGLGYYFSHLGYVAEVAEVTVAPDGRLTVDRVTAAADVGSQIVNLSGAENQVQGSINDGLNACWGQELTIERGRVTQTNFHQYPMLRMPQSVRRIDVHFVKTEYPPTGLGEPALPPLAPAVGNAIFAATGIRIRDFPFTRTSLKWS